MDLSNPQTSSNFQEQIPLENLNLDQTDEQDGRPKSKLRRASTDVMAQESRPQQRVRFHTLAAGEGRQLSTEEFELLSAKAHQIGPATRLGGWQNTIFTRRRQGWTPKSEEEEVQEIAQAMEEDQRLMADDVDGEVLRRDALRELPKSIKVKKEIKQRLTLSKTSERHKSERKLSYFKSFGYMLEMKWYKFTETLKMAWRDFSLWHKAIKEVEGIFGTSVGTYFYFLRYLFLLDSSVAFVVITILLVPQMYYGSIDKTENGFNSTNAFEHDTPDSSLNAQPNSSSFGLLDWLTGAGWFSHTPLYYGAYSTGVLTSGASVPVYNMSKAYFFTVTCCFVVCFILLLYRIFMMYRVNFIDTNEELSVSFVELIVAAWDFNITDEKAAAVKRRSIYNELMEMLQEYQEEEEVEGFLRRIGKRLVKAAVWFVLLCFLFLLGAGLYLLLKDEFHFLPEQQNSGLLLVYPLIVTCLMVVVPMVFEAIGRLEKYSKPRFEIYASLVRVILLEVVVLVALVVFWYEKSPGLSDELSLKRTVVFSALEDNGEEVAPPVNITTVQCWENALGQEIYRLVFVDFLVILISTLVVDTLKPFLVYREVAKERVLEFSIARNTLHLIYNQTLLWAGLFFCPLLPLVIAIKFAFIFFLQKLSVTKNLQPVERPWRAAQTETLFYALTLLTLLLAFFSFVFIVVRGYCSPSCGPFQGLTHYKDIIWNASGATEQMVINVLMFALRPGSVHLIILFLCLVVYYLKSFSDGRMELVNVLRTQLHVESRDRVFLQRLIENVQRGKRISRMQSPQGGQAPQVRSPSRNTPSPGTSPPQKRWTKKSSFVFARNTSRDGDELNGTNM